MIRRMPYSGNCKLFRTILTHSLRFPIEEKRREFILYFLGFPKTHAVFGKSGGTSRPMMPSIILCDLVAEREGFPALRDRETIL